MKKMKKFLVGLVVLFVLTIFLPLAANAQSCRGRGNHYGRNNNRGNNRSYNGNRYANYNNNRRSYEGNRYGGYNNNRRSYGTQGYYVTNQRPSFYRRHRNAINLGIGSGGGAIIGALTGGRRGALVGTAIGAGSSALYTYVLNPKKGRYSRR